MKLKPFELAERMHDTFQLALLDAHSVEVGTDWVDLFDEDKAAYAEGAAAAVNMAIRAMILDLRASVAMDDVDYPMLRMPKGTYVSLDEWLESFLMPEERFG